MNYGVKTLTVQQLPEDEESIPPILQYNNHMGGKDM